MAGSVMAGTGDGRAPTSELTARGVPFWLPPGGEGNGIPAANWALLVELDLGLVDGVVDALTAAHIATYVVAGRPRGRAGASGRGANRRGQVRDELGHLLWVDSLHHAGAENILMRVLALCQDDRRDTW